ncbi:hypothetical protein OROMI_024689 [Orobanche minor]
MPIETQPPHPLRPPFASQTPIPWDPIAFKRALRNPMIEARHRKNQRLVEERLNERRNWVKTDWSDFKFPRENTPCLSTDTEDGRIAIAKLTEDYRSFLADETRITFFDAPLMEGPIHTTNGPHKYLHPPKSTQVHYPTRHDRLEALPQLSMGHVSLVYVDVVLDADV